MRRREERREGEEEKRERDGRDESEGAPSYWRWILNALPSARVE